MSERKDAGSVDEYIDGFPVRTREALKQLRAVIRAVVPEAVERISYGMPTFDLNGKHLVHFAGHTNHVGLYPLPGVIEAFKEELGPYTFAKGSVQFPLDQPLPADLISRMVEFRVREMSVNNRAKP